MVLSIVLSIVFSTQQLDFPIQKTIPALGEAAEKRRPQLCEGGAPARLQPLGAMEAGGFDEAVVNLLW